MHRIARLKRNHSPPAEAGEFCSQLCWSEPQGLEIIVGARLNAFYPASDIPWMRLIEQIIDAGMGMARALEYRFRLRLFIWLPDFLNMQDGEHNSFWVAQRNCAAPRLQRAGKLFGYIQSDGHRPQHTTGQAHLVTYSFIIRAGHEAAQR